MTLLETERLVRKITDLLHQEGNATVAPKLAEDFAAACHAANLRLQQCEAMIKAGDRQQAIQLAETAPNLLDLITVLEFRGADDWRVYCQQNSLAVADRIDARSVHALNECYGQGITTDHPLYSIYRSTMLSRSDDAALKALQSITRLNPADASAASELTRLDAKVLAAKLHHLEDLMQGADPALLVAEIEAIEAFCFKNKPEGEVWRKAQTIRCGYLLEEAATLKSSSNWVDALSNIEFVHRLQDEFKCELSAQSLKQLEIIEKWARGEEERYKKEREFQSLLGELQHCIHQSEEKDTSARYVKLPELQDDYEALHKVWRSLTDFARPIPAEAASGFRKRSGLLEAEIQRRTAINRRVIIAGSLTTFLVGAILVWFVLGRMKARDFTRQLHDAVARRQVHTAEKLLERAGNEKIGNVDAVADAQTFVTKEHALKANFEAAFSKLPQQLGGEPDASRLTGLADQLALARNTFKALAPDLKAENEPRLQAFEKQWQKFLSESGSVVNSLLDRWVSSAESQSLELDYRAPLDKTTAQIKNLASLVQKISDCESGFSNHLGLRNDLLQRAASVKAKFTAYDSELKKLDQGTAAVQSARTLKEFSDGIKLITSSEFSGSPAATAASLVQSLNVDDETTVRILLGATNASTWAYIKRKRTASFVPDVVMPAERQIFGQLVDDPAISANVQHYRLWPDQDTSEPMELIVDGPLLSSTGTILSNYVTGTITERPDDAENGNRTKGWMKSASATSATFTDFNYIYFNGHLKVKSANKEWQPIFRFEHVDAPNEVAAFKSVGLEKVWPGPESKAKPLLEVLDSIKDSREGSPLFRAYLFLRLMDLMNLQPDAWGINFCPAVRAHEAQIRGIVGERFGSGDWFVPAKVNAFSKRLEKFFASVKPISYSKQANGLLSIALAVSNDGLRYVGYAGLDDKFHYVDDSVPEEVWGYSAANRQPMLLATMEATNPRSIRGMPLTPLFALGSPRKGYLAKAGVNFDDASFQGALPPLFQQGIRR